MSTTTPVHLDVRPVPQPVGDRLEHACLVQGEQPLVDLEEPALRQRVIDEAHAAYDAKVARVGDDLLGARLASGLARRRRRGGPLCRGQRLSAARLVHGHVLQARDLALLDAQVASISHVAMMYLPLGQKVLGTAPVEIGTWLLLIPLALVVLVVMEIHKWTWRRFRS